MERPGLSPIVTASSDSCVTRPGCTIRGVDAFGAFNSVAAVRRLVGACAACAAPLVLAGCVTIHTDNPAFPASEREISAELSRMRANPAGLERPVIVLAGYRSPMPIASGLAETICTLTGADRERVADLSYIWSGTIEGPAQKAVALVEERFPSDDPEWTTEVDVVAISMGGLVARLAAADPSMRAEPGGKRLRIRTLYSLASPHRGATLAEWIRLDRAARDMRPGSDFLARLDDAFAERSYEVVAYAVLRDGWVGAKHASPIGMDPIWVSGRLVLSHHLVSFNRRIQADLARRLRGEEPLGQASSPPRE